MYERLTATFRTIGVDYEIIFVNDASPDNAREVLAELAARDPRVVVINHTRNFGSQSAFTSGMRIATGDAVVLLDGDLQDPPELIEEFHEKWLEGCDVVYGVRVQREATLPCASPTRCSTASSGRRRTSRSRSTPATSRCSTAAWSTR